MSKTKKRALRLQQRKEDVKAQRATAAKRKRNKQIINGAIIAVIVIAALTIIISSLPERDDPRLERFAKCITAAGAGMYGTDSCGACQEQKRMFGTAFKNIAYINCEINTMACENERVHGFPTWIFGDGSRVTGVQQINDFTEQTGCVFE